MLNPSYRWRTRRILVVLAVFIFVNLIFFGAPRNNYNKAKDDDDEGSFWYGDDPSITSVESKENRDTSDVEKTHKDDEVRNWTKDMEDEGSTSESTGESETTPNPKSPLGEHTYRSDGLIEVNPDAAHPIYDLIKRAEEQWHEKHDRASKTLTDAVKEYKRRYKRWPPKGFDKWWSYVQENHVQLPDEYDQIFHDISPYLGMRAVEVRTQQSSVEKQSGTFTLVSKHGKVTLEVVANQENMAEVRGNDQRELLLPVQQWLPDFRATFTAHDGPSQFASYSLKSDAREMAVLGTYLDPQKNYKNHHGWEDACPKNAPIWSYDRKVNLTELWNEPKTFIWDHKASMNPCLHPSHTRLTGFFNGFGIGPVSQTSLIPEFAMCSTQLHADILTVAVEWWTEDVDADVDWNDKSDDRLSWRGSNTGIYFGPQQSWNISQRIRLVATANELDGYVDVLRSTEDPGDPVGTPQKLHKGTLNRALLDVHFASEPIQCEESVCHELWDMFEWKEIQSFEEAWKYKYIMDIDGNGWSARFKRLMTSRSLIFKSTVFPEWYMDRIQPWIHYVPIKNDFAELYDVLTFFRGDSEGNDGHDDLAEKIATDGRKWSLSYWRIEDLVAYAFRLFLEYGRVYALDRGEMDFTLDDAKKIEEEEAFSTV